MKNPWTTNKKRWLYKIDEVFCHEGSSVLNRAFEEEALEELGKDGWEVFKIEKKELSIPVTIYEFIVRKSNCRLMSSLSWDFLE